MRGQCRKALNPHIYTCTRTRLWACRAAFGFSAYASAKPSIVKHRASDCAGNWVLDGVEAPSDWYSIVCIRVCIYARVLCRWACVLCEWRSYKLYKVTGQFLYSLTYDDCQLVAKSLCARRLLLRSHIDPQDAYANFRRIHEIMIFVRISSMNSHNRVHDHQLN